MGIVQRRSDKCDSEKGNSRELRSTEKETRENYGRQKRNARKTKIFALCRAREVVVKSLTC